MFLLALACARLDHFRDGCYLALVSDREIQDHVHHFVDHRVELVALAINTIETARSYSSLRSTSISSMPLCMSYWLAPHAFSGSSLALTRRILRPNSWSPRVCSQP